QHDLGADHDRIGELDGVGPLLAVLARRVDPRLAVVLADEPVLEPLGILTGDAPAERLAGLEPELLDQLGRLEGVRGGIEDDGADVGARAAVDAVGDHGAAGDRVGLDGDADPRAEVAAAVVQVPERLDTLYDLVLGERLGLPLGDGPPQVVLLQAQLAGDAYLRYLHQGA